jgi:hypothetical protein
MGPFFSVLVSKRRDVEVAAKAISIAAMSGRADVEACYERLHRAGWSIGEVGTTSKWLVTARGMVLGRRPPRAGQ